MGGYVVKINFFAIDNRNDRGNNEMFINCSIIDL